MLECLLRPHPPTGASVSLLTVYRESDLLGNREEERKAFGTWRKVHTYSYREE